MSKNEPLDVANLEWQRSAQSSQGHASHAFRPLPDGRNDCLSTTHRQQDRSTPPRPFGVFSADVWLIVFESLQKPALRRVSRSSRSMHALTIPSLYRIINMSINSAIGISNFRSVRSWPANLQNLLVQQWRFVQQILEKPEYASYVRSFTWTMGLENMRRLPPWVKDKEAIWKPETIYAMFALLDKATTVIVETGTWRPGTSPLLPPLFPAAQKISLGGIMHHDLASAILHGPDKAPLHSLTIKNVFEGGLLCGGAIHRFWRAISEGNAWPTQASSDRIEYHSAVRVDRPVYSLPAQFTPDCIQQLLAPSFLHRCRHLAFLHLEKRDPHDLYQGLLSPIHHDRDVFIEWAALLRAVRPKAVLIADDGYIFQTWGFAISRQRQCPATPPRCVALMSRDFRTVLLPALQNGWPGLERGELRGVSRSALGTVDELESIAIEVADAVEGWRRETPWTVLDG